MSNQNAPEGNWQQWSASQQRANDEAWAKWDAQQAQQQPQSPYSQQQSPGYWQPQAAPGAPKKPGRSSKKLFIGIGAGALALVLIAVLGVVLWPRGGKSDFVALQGYADAPNDSFSIDYDSGKRLTVLDDSKLIVWGYDDEDIAMYSLEDGSELWASDLPSTTEASFGYSLAPLHNSHQLLVQYNTEDGERKAVVLDSNNGETVETITLEPFQMLIATESDELLLLEGAEGDTEDQDGKLSLLNGFDTASPKWTHTLKGEGQCAWETAREQETSTATVRGDVLIVSLCYEQRVLGLEDGKKPSWARNARAYYPAGKYLSEGRDDMEKWNLLDGQGKKLASGLKGRPVVIDNELYLLDGNSLRRLDTKDFTSRWTARLTDEQVSLFVHEDNGNLVVNGKLLLPSVDDDELEVTSIDLKTGKKDGPKQKFVLDELGTATEVGEVFQGEGRLVVAIRDEGDGEESQVHLTSVKPGRDEPDWTTSFDGGGATQLGRKLAVYSEGKLVILGN